MTLDPSSDTRRARRHRSVRLRPLGVGEILDEALSLYRENIGLFLSVIWFPTIVVAVTSSLWNIGLPWMFKTEDPGVAAFAGLVLLATIPVFLLAWAYQQAAITVAIGQRYLQRPITSREVHGRVLALVLKLIGSYLLAGLLTVVAFLILAVSFGFLGYGINTAVGASTGLGPGGLLAVITIPLTAVLLFVLAGVLFAFLGPVVVLEQEGVWNSILRSVALAGAHFFRVFGLVVLLVVVTLILSLILQLALIASLTPFGVDLERVFEPTTLTPTSALVEGFSMVLSGGLNLLMVPFASAVMVLAYFDVRIRKEGFDIAVLASTLGHRPADSGLVQ